MWNQEKSKYKELKKGQNIVSLEEIKNGDIIIPAWTSGQIVYNQNQVVADIWYRDYHEYKDNLEIKVETNWNSQTQFRGVVLTTKKEMFAVAYQYDDHENVRFREEQIKDLEFIRWDILRSHESQWYINNERGREYKLCDIVDNIECEFSDWVEQLDTYQLDEEEKENYSDDVDWIFTAESQEKYNIKQQEIQQSFAKATGFYYEFTGGAIEV